MKNDNRSDEDIVTAVTLGARDDYALIVHRYQQKLLRYVIVLIHNPSAAEDIVQDTFIKAYENLNSFNPHYKFSSWIYRIAHNETMNYVKKRSKIDTDFDISTVIDKSTGLSVADKLDASFLAKNVQACLAEVDETSREILILYYYEDMKYTEISDVLHMPVATVGVKLSRAKAQLKRICRAKGVQYEER